LALLPQNVEDPFRHVLETVLLGRHPHIARWQWESAMTSPSLRTPWSRGALPLRGTRCVLAYLSGGERRRAALAAILAQTPRIFFSTSRPTN